MQGSENREGGDAISLARVMGLLPRATLHAAAPSQSNKNKNKMTFSCNGTRNNGIVAARKPLNPLLVTASVYRRFRLARKKHNKTKQSKQNTTTRSAAARRQPDCLPTDTALIFALAWWDVSEEAPPWIFLHDRRGGANNRLPSRVFFSEINQ